MIIESFFNELIKISSPGCYRCAKCGYQSDNPISKCPKCGSVDIRPCTPVKGEYLKRPHGGKVTKPTFSHDISEQPDNGMEKESD